MPIDFPPSPGTGDIYTFNSKSWVWNGSGWLTAGSGFQAVGVTDVNGITGSVGVTSGTYIQLARSGNTLTISATEPPLLDGGIF